MFLHDSHAGCQWGIPQLRETGVGSETFCCQMRELQLLCSRPQSYTKCSIFIWSNFTLDVVAIGTPILGWVREEKNARVKKRGGATRIKNQIDINSFLYLAACFIELRCAQRKRSYFFSVMATEKKFVAAWPASVHRLCSDTLCNDTCAMTLMQWHLCNDICAVILVQWHLCSDTCAVTLVQWHLCSDT
jgi:hypothetical protein